MSGVPLDSIVLATKNPHKVVEVSELVDRLGLAEEVLTGLSWDDVDESADTIEGNALLKARAVRRATGYPALADDTGLEVVVLDGRPGVKSARYAGEDATPDDNIDLLLEELSDVGNRDARFVTVVALAHPHGWELTAEGEVRGVITTGRRGEEGFGYDPVFEVGGRTFAEMGRDAKQRLSHRARAMENLYRRLT